MGKVRGQSFLGCKPGIKRCIALLFVALFSPLLLPVLPVKAAASLSLSPASAKVNTGQSTTLTLYVNAGQAINSVGATIVLPEAYVTPVSVNKSGSILTTWPQEPSISGSTITFSGGLPTPGYTGSGGKILSFTIKGKAEGTGVINLSSAQVLANDGRGTNVISGSASATITVVQTLANSSISSSTHPDQSKWYALKNADLSWTKPANFQSFDWTLGKGGQVVKQDATSKTNSASFKDLEDGIWAFRLTTKYNNGSTLESSFTLKIDTVAPNDFEIVITQTSPKDSAPSLQYSAKDDLSGIDHYIIIVDLDEVANTAEGSFKLPRQRPGTHKLTIKAYDKAGNVKEKIKSFSVEGTAAPVITYWSRFVSVLEPITFKGKAHYGAKIQLFSKNEKIAEFVVKENLTERQRRDLASQTIATDQEVEWIYIYKGVLYPGNHDFYAIQIEESGDESNPSNTVSVKVIPGSISFRGFSIPFILIAIILIPVLLLLLLIIMRLHKKIKLYFNQKKQRLLTLQEKVDQDVVSLEKTVVPGVKESDVDEVEKQIKKAKEQIDQEFTDEMKGHLKDEKP